MILCNSAPSSVINSNPDVSLSKRPIVDSAGVRYLHRSGKKSYSSLPTSLCEQVTPLGLFIIRTMPGIGSNFSPLIYNRSRTSELILTDYDFTMNFGHKILISTIATLRSHSQKLPTALNGSLSRKFLLLFQK